MTTLTEFQSDDTGSELLGGLNSNFEALNNDKIEADSADTLENKNIDCDDNTVTNVKPANVASANKTGADTQFATGTKGDANEIAMWNADGDIVTSDKTFTASAPSSTSTDSTVPTSQAVHEAIATALLQKEKWFPMIKATDADTYVTAVGNYAVARLDATDDGYFNFTVPSDFSSITSIDLVIIPDTTETISLDVDVNIAAVGEAYTNLTGTAPNVTKAVTINVMTAWDLNAVTGNPFLGITAGDIVGVAINSDTSSLQVIGLRFKYT